MKMRSMLNSKKLKKFKSLFLSKDPLLPTNFEIKEKKFQCLSEISKLEHSTKKILEPRGRLFCWTYIRSFFLFRIHIPSHSLGGVCLSLWQMHTIHKPHDNLDFNIRRDPYS